MTKAFGSAITKQIQGHLQALKDQLKAAAAFPKELQRAIPVYSALCEMSSEGTTAYDRIATPRNFRRARALLKHQKLWPVPRTKADLERALRTRLRRRVPVSLRRKRARRMPWSPMTMFANLLSW